MRIERYCTLEQRDRPGITVTPQCSRIGGPPANNIVERDGLLGRPGGLRIDQRLIERDRAALRDLVLQGERSGGVAVKTLHPWMRVGLCIDQMGVDANAVGTAPCATFQYIANAQFTEVDPENETVG